MAFSPPAVTTAAATVTYLVTAVPMGLMIARARGIDLRRVGSGNIGATNAVRAMGPRWGALVFALDVAKAFLPVWLASRWPPLAQLENAELAVVIVMVSAVVGHVFPVYLGFRGGKGVACALGAFLAVESTTGVGRRCDVRANRSFDAHVRRSVHSRP